MDMPRCSTCRWWDIEPHDEGMGVSRCLRIPEWWDATTWSDEGDRVWTAEANGILAFANDGSSYRADLLTLPNFGCVMHVADAPGENRDTLRYLARIQSGSAPYGSNEMLFRLKDLGWIEQVGRWDWKITPAGVKALQAIPDEKP